MSLVLPEGLTVNRTGVTTEYKRGVFYLSHTVWEDGHEEIEVHRCAPEQLFHSYDESEKSEPAPEQALHTCDSKQFAEVFAAFAKLPLELPAPLDPKDRILSVLKALETAIPPPSGARHSFTYARYGSDESGWRDHLALYIQTETGVGRCLFVEAGDLTKPLPALVDAVKEALLRLPLADGATLSSGTE